MDYEGMVDGLISLLERVKTEKEEINGFDIVLEKFIEESPLGKYDAYLDELYEGALKTIDYILEDLDDQRYSIYRTLDIIEEAQNCEE